ncbi:hypothetical protein D6783_03655 [Candidatus Woesearchaeota archaeon]|nr:MAG: hypothetical protein D6783_03655 [Candidatus Woesearchaeota archaeon]
MTPQRNQQAPTTPLLNKGKRGVVFTMIAISLATLLLALFIWTYTADVQSDLDIINLRVFYLNNFLNDLDEYIELALTVGSRNTLEAMSTYIKDNGYVADAQLAFHTCFLEGNITPGGPPCGLAYNNSAQRWLDEVQRHVADTMKITFEYEFHNVTITQKYPFHLDVTLNATVKLYDVFATWNYTKIYNISMPVEGLTDPGIIKEFSERRIIRRSPREITGIWGVPGLTEMYQNKEYRWFDEAPSFLERYEGNFTNSSCCGIETLINTSTLVTNKHNRSFTDYQLFKDLNFTCGEEVFSITGFVDPSFQLDTEHLATFQILATRWSNATCP